MRLPDDSVFVLFIAFFIYAASNRLCYNWTAFFDSMAHI